MFERISRSDVPTRFRQEETVPAVTVMEVTVGAGREGFVLKLRGLIGVILTFQELFTKAEKLIEYLVSELNAESGVNVRTVFPADQEYAPVTAGEKEIPD